MYLITYHLNGKTYRREFELDQHVAALYYLRKLHKVLLQCGSATYNRTADTLDVYYGNNVAVINVVRFQEVRHKSF